MKQFTLEEIAMGIVVIYENQKAIAHTAEEARDIINGYKSYRSCADGAKLICNDYTFKYLVKLFNAEPVEYLSFRTTNCGNHDINFRPALAPTIEEHNAIYEARCEAEKQERIRIANERNEKLRKEFEEKKRGWYRVTLYISAINPLNDRRQYRYASACMLADSKMDAYNQMASRGANECCNDAHIIYENCSAWNSGNTEVIFLGMKTDDGFSVEEWDEYQTRNK